MWNVAHPHPQLVHEGKLTMYMGVKGPPVYMWRAVGSQGNRS